jgi:zinc finger BED domain-containing protein 1 (E3 SUMO-protein ligase ZBED1)
MKFFSMTSDGWKSPLSSSAHWYSITIHWIDKDFRLQFVLFDLYDAELHSTADNILKQWNIHLQPLVEKYSPFGIVTDGEAATQSARATLCSTLDMKPIWCVCHRLNLASKYIVKIEEVEDAYKKCKAISKFAKKSTVFGGIFQMLKSKKTIQLCSASEIRWNSSYNMFKSFLDNKDALEQACNQTGYPNRQRLNSRDWSFIEMASEVLLIIKPEIKFFQAEKVPTISSVLPRLLTLKEIITGLSPRNKIALDAVVELEDYFPWLSSWDPPSEEFSILSSASFLDPRYKDFFFIEDQGKRDQLVSSIRPAIEQILLPGGPAVEADHSRESPVTIQMRRRSLAAERQGEIERYLALARDPEVTEDPLNFWRSVRPNDFPTLSQVARRVLCLPASSTTSERAFSSAGSVLSKSRTRLSSVSSRSACLINVNRSLISSITELPNLSNDQITAFFRGEEEGDGEEGEEGEEGDDEPNE